MAEARKGFVVSFVSAQSATTAFEAIKERVRTTRLPFPILIKFGTCPPDELPYPFALAIACRAEEARALHRWPWIRQAGDVMTVHSGPCCLDFFDYQFRVIDTYEHNQSLVDRII